MIKTRDELNLLEEKIFESATVLPGDIIKVDNFLNHQVDTDVMNWISEEFARRFEACKPTKVLTLEASGIPPAVLTAMHLQVPFVFAKKAKSQNLGNQEVYRSKVVSYTYKNEYMITVAKKYLSKEDRVLIIDDFLATGEASFGLLDLCEQAGAEVVGIGICIEKGYQTGGQKLREKGYNLESIAIIESIDENNQIQFRK